jgi:predicted NAD/FAD-dependent oxidoreductase
MTHITELNWASTSNEIDSASCAKYETGFDRAPSTSNTREDNSWPESGFGGPSGMAGAIYNNENLNIQFDTVVTEVEQDGSTVTIQTESGDVYTANRAIVTLPLGVLKNGDVLFTPALNNDKKVAIDRLGMGTCNKVYMAFEEQNFAGAPWASGCVGGNMKKCLSSAKTTAAECESTCDPANMRNELEYFAAEAARADQVIDRTRFL